MNPLVSIPLPAGPSSFNTDLAINAAIRSGFWQLLEVPITGQPALGHYSR